MDGWALVFFYGSALGVWVLYLMAPLNPHKYPYMMSCSLLNFEALQWITPRNGIANLWTVNLDVLSSKWTFFLAHGGRDFTGQHLPNGTKTFYCSFISTALLQDCFQRRLNDTNSCHEQKFSTL